MEEAMAARKPFHGQPSTSKELTRLLKLEATKPVTEEQLQEQRVSFAYGNAMNEDGITKESIRAASKSIRIVQG